MHDLQRLREKNPGLNIKTLDDARFSAYGKVVSLRTAAKLIEVLEEQTTIPEQGNCYTASVPAFEHLPGTAEYLPYFGGMPFQIGFCNGRGNSMGGLEWHNCPEITLCGDDAVFFLARKEAMHGVKLDSASVEAFFAPKGSCFLLYPTVLHMAPNELDGKGFRTLIVLEKDTNTDLDDETKRELALSPDAEARCLFKKNKWIIAHVDNKALIARGVQAGITGVDPEVHPID